MVLWIIYHWRSLTWRLQTHFSSRALEHTQQNFSVLCFFEKSLMLSIFFPLSFRMCGNRDDLLPLRTSLTSTDFTPFFCSFSNLTLKLTHILLCNRAESVHSLSLFLARIPIHLPPHSSLFRWFLCYTWKCKKKISGIDSKLLTLVEDLI